VKSRWTRLPRRTTGAACQPFAVTDRSEERRSSRTGAHQERAISGNKQRSQTGKDAQSARRLGDSWQTKYLPRKFKQKRLDVLDGIRIP
jgi:hypothetical protein